MLDDNDTSSPPEMQAETSGNYVPETYDIAPEDEALADSLVNQDPIRDLTGPATTVGAVKLPSQLTREMLPTDVRASVDARLETLPAGARGAAEAGIIRDEAEKYAYAVRVWGGPGPDANAYQQERFLLENEVYQAQTQLVERESALAEVIRHDRKVDEQTGETWDEPIYRVQGDARSAAEHEAADLRQRIALLRGSEGQRRLAKARWQAVQDVKRLQDEVAIDEEAKMQAQRDERAARVADRAKAYRKFEATER